MIGIGIVVYNPDFEALINNIRSLGDFAGKIVIVNNSYERKMAFDSLLLVCSNIEIIHNKKNVGVAKAYNQIFEACRYTEIEWVMTLDQDSYFKSIACLEAMEDAIAFCEESFGIIYPSLQYITQNGKSYPRKIIKKDSNYAYDVCISSGSLIRYSAWEKVGGFDESFFIDMVDFDFCYSLCERGYKIFECEEAVLMHHLGDLNIVKIGDRDIWVTYHNKERKYYLVRNSVLCHKKHPHIYGKRRLFTDIMHNVLKAILFESEKCTKLIYMAKGLKDGLRNCNWKNK